MQPLEYLENTVTVGFIKSDAGIFDREFNHFCHTGADGIIPVIIKYVII